MANHPPIPSYYMPVPSTLAQGPERTRNDSGAAGAWVNGG